MHLEDDFSKLNDQKPKVAALFIRFEPQFVALKQTARRILKKEFLNDWINARQFTLTVPLTDRLT